MYLNFYVNDKLVQSFELVDDSMVDKILSDDIIIEIQNTLEHKADEIVKDKIDYEKDNMVSFIHEIIEPLLWDCAAEMVTIESMSQIELAHKIEDEIISHSVFENDPANKQFMDNAW